MDILTTKFWTAKRRTWLYSIMVALVPVLVTVGTLTTELATQLLNVAAAVLAVGGGAMALNHITPDNVVQIGVKVDNE
jgi:hypothetical protein